MVRDNLQRHDHQAAGDGGSIDFAQRANDSSTSIDGAMTQVDSGTLTVAANGSDSVAVSGPSRDTHLLFTAYPDGDYGSEFSHNGFGHQITGTGVGLVWDDTAGNWKVEVNEGVGSEVTVTWRVYEV